MISSGMVTAICLGAALCAAQTINISGIVKDNAGAGISGATVKLVVADITTTTEADGSFTLIGSTQIKQDIINRGITASTIRIQNGKITIKLSENTPVAINIYDVVGRQLYSDKRTYGSGTHAIQAPLRSAGIFLYRATIGNEAYSFKSSPFGTFSTERSTAFSGTSTLAKHAKATAVIADVISVVKEGQLNYRDSIKTSEASGIVVRMIPNAGNVTDADGNVYQSVRIGNQVWTVENLKTTKYNDGTPISNVTDNTQWVSLTTEAYCYYDNSTVNKDKYGALYNWYAVSTGKLAPKDWKVPTDAEWTVLENYLIANGYNWDETKSGNKIAKAMAAKTDWISDTTAGATGNDPSKNNTSGFSALPGGFRFIDGTFGVQSTRSDWWSATGRSETGAYGRTLNFGTADLLRGDRSKIRGFSIRLLLSRPALVLD